MVSGSFQTMPDTSHGPEAPFWNFRTLRESELTPKLVAARGGLYRPNTYSTVALRCSLSSGVLASRRLADSPPPDTIATYCLPLTSKLMGGALKGAPRFIFHNSSSVVSS